MHCINYNAILVRTQANKPLPKRSNALVVVVHVYRGVDTPTCTQTRTQTHTRGARMSYGRGRVKLAK